MTDQSSESPNRTTIAQIVDDHLRWLTAWHQAAFFGTPSAPEHFGAAAGGSQVIGPLRPPESFHQWFAASAVSLVAQQPVIDRLAVQHDQLHTIARMVLLKAKPGAMNITEADYALVMGRFDDFMSALRRIERAFAVAASGLDPLTGLRSRVGLMEDLAREQSRLDRGGPSFCIALADVDHFKRINDTHGHPVGDRVLAGVADAITRTIRTFDDAYRAGGEEFLIVLKGASVTDAANVLERLRASLAAQSLALPDGQSISATASFGVAEAQPGLAIATLLERADAALYQAKDKGRNRVEIVDTVTQG